MRRFLRVKLICSLVHAFGNEGSISNMQLKIASTGDLNVLLPLISAYHQFEGIASSEAERAESVAPLLQSDSQYGRIWLVLDAGEVAGYIALCFGYSIEFGGRDAFIDEFFIREEARGRGIGSRVLMAIKNEAARLRVKVLHLEVDRTNQKAKKLYAKHGFIDRSRFQLMSCRLEGDAP